MAADSDSPAGLMGTGRAVVLFMSVEIFLHICAAVLDTLLRLALDSQRAGRSRSGARNNLA